jgi:hypothetical protein
MLKGEGTEMKPVMRWALAALLTTVTAAAQQPSGAIDVYKTPTCGCCSKWVEHLRANGFAVKVTDMESTGPVQNRYGVPPAVRSCHTALVNGYIVEGHVPAGEVKRLLKERPGVAGIAVAGMPSGSPGMEMQGVDPQPYHVVSFDRSGRIDVFASYGR